jgi:predicted GNAT family acetyltransferase
MAQVTTRPAASTDFGFAWNIYREYVEPLVRPHMTRSWSDDDEKERFRKIWKPEAAHIILVNGKAAGWFSCDVGQSVAIEHGYLDTEHRGRGIGGIILRFIVDEARKQNKKVVFSTFKSQPAFQITHHGEFSVIKDDAMLTTVEIS